MPWSSPVLTSTVSSGSNDSSPLLSLLLYLLGIFVFTTSPAVERLVTLKAGRSSLRYAIVNVDQGGTGLNKNT